MLKSFVGGAVQTELTAAITNVATSFTIADATGWVFPRRFVVVIDRGRLTEEKVLCTAINGTTVTVQQRGWDGTVAQAHDAGASVMHALDAHTLREFNLNSWHLIESKSPAAVASNTLGNMFFDNIPLAYTRLRITVPWMSHSSTSSGHLYYRLNQDSGANYGWHAMYHTSSSWTGTTGAGHNNGYLIYSYFYGGSTRRTFMEVDIWTKPGSRPGIDARAFTPIGDNSYPYGSHCKSTWNSTADITRIDMWTSVTATWDVNSVFNLYGMVEEAA